MLLMKTCGRVFKLFDFCFCSQKQELVSYEMVEKKIHRKKKMPLSSLKQSTIFHYSEKLE